jgi:transcriptional repressor NrdR
MAMDKLRQLDHIAYIRFASVYQSFEDIEQLQREVNTLLAEREQLEQDDAPRAPGGGAGGKRYPKR